jgi:predicted nucleotidyltransferase
MPSASRCAIKRPETVPTGLHHPVGKSLHAATRRIAHELQPERIILFGSYAYGHPTPDSDVDLMVILNTDLPPLHRYLLVSRLLDPRPFPVDILVKTPGEIEKGLASGDSLLRQIIEQGVVLYERIG